MTEVGNRRPIAARGTALATRGAKALSDAGLTPNQISVIGLLAAIGAGVCLSLTPVGGAAERILFLCAAALIVCRGLANMFDGMVAVEHGKAGPTGALYNEVPDRFSDAALFVGAGYATGSVPELGYWAALVAVLVAFVRFAAQVAGAPADYSGIMAKQQRMFLLAAAALWLALAPAPWRPAFGSQGEFGLIAIVLALIILGGCASLVGRLRRAARWLTDNAAD